MWLGDMPFNVRADARADGVHGKAVQQLHQLLDLQRKTGKVRGDGGGGGGGAKKPRETPTPRAAGKTTGPPHIRQD